MVRGNSDTGTRIAQLGSVITAGPPRSTQMMGIPNAMASRNTIPHGVLETRVQQDVSPPSTGQERSSGGSLPAGGHGRAVMAVDWPLLPSTIRPSPTIQYSTSETPFRALAWIPSWMPFSAASVPTLRKHNRSPRGAGVAVSRPRSGSTTPRPAARQLFVIPAPAFNLLSRSSCQWRTQPGERTPTRMGHARRAIARESGPGLGSFRTG